MPLPAGSSQSSISRLRLYRRGISRRAPKWQSLRRAAHRDPRPTRSPRNYSVLFTPGQRRGRFRHLPHPYNCATLYMPGFRLPQGASIAWPRSGIAAPWPALTSHDWKYPYRETTGPIALRGVLISSCRPRAHLADLKARFPNRRAYP